MRIGKKKRCERGANLEKAMSGKTTVGRNNINPADKKNQKNTCSVMKMDYGKQAYLTISKEIPSERLSEEQGLFTNNG